MCFFSIFFFFFKQKTAYEMRISDWSSDVCSSDLHLVPLSHQAVAILRALWPLTGACPLLFPSNRHPHRPMSENAIGYLLNRAGYHGRHVPHGFRAAFSTIMNEWAERQGKKHDRKNNALMPAHQKRKNGGKGKK